MSDETQQLELTIEEARKLVEKKDMALKLAENREFKALILEGYFKEEAARLAGISADPAFKGSEDEIQTAIKGISCLRQYLQKQLRLGYQAENDIRDAEEALEEERVLEDEVS